MLQPMAPPPCVRTPHSRQRLGLCAQHRRRQARRPARRRHLGEAAATEQVQMHHALDVCKSDSILKQRPAEGCSSSPASARLGGRSANMQGHSSELAANAGCIMSHTHPNVGDVLKLVRWPPQCGIYSLSSLSAESKPMGREHVLFAARRRRRTLGRMSAAGTTSSSECGDGTHRYAAA
jgi:hypothetical protein